MSELRKANTDYCYFITFTVVGWIDVFTRSKYSDVILESLEYCQKNKGLEVFEFVIMPSHVHLIVRRLEGKLSDVLRDMKAYTAKKIIKMIEEEQGESRKEWLLYMFQYYAKYTKQNEKYQFWQKTSFPVQLSNHEMYSQKVEYILLNPVEAGYISAPEQWQYSSANNVSKIKLDVW
jgi:putative transposase